MGEWGKGKGERARGQGKQTRKEDREKGMKGERATGKGQGKQTRKEGRKKGMVDDGWMEERKGEEGASPLDKGLLSPTCLLWRSSSS